MNRSTNQIVELTLPVILQNIPVSLQGVVNGGGLGLAGRVLGHALVDLAQPAEKAVDLRGHGRKLLIRAGVGRQKRLFVARRRGGSGAAQMSADLGEGHQLHIDLVFQLAGLRLKKNQITIEALFNTHIK